MSCYHLTAPELVFFHLRNLLVFFLGRSTRFGLVISNLSPFTNMGNLSHWIALARFGVGTEITLKTGLILMALV
jgi:hypothetical protein